MPMQIANVAHCDIEDGEVATEYTIIGQTSSISSTSGSGSTSATGASNSLGSSATAAVTNMPQQSTRQYITVTQSPLIQKRTNNAKQESSDVKVSTRKTKLYSRIDHVDDIDALASCQHRLLIFISSCLPSICNQLIIENDYGDR